MGRPSRAFATRLLVVSAIVLAACAGSGGPTEPPASPRARAGPAPKLISNVERRDYAGSEACRPCHAAMVETFLDSPMHRMTRLAPNLDRAPFDGRRFGFKGDSVDLYAKGGRGYMRVRSRFDGDALYRVTKIIGGRVREDYAGVRVLTDAADSRVMTSPPDELVLPVSFLIESRRLRYKGYSVMSPVRPGLRAGPVWNQTCIGCHNTVPFFDVMLGPLSRRKRPRHQLITVDRILPSELRADWRANDPDGLAAALDREASALGHAPIAQGDLRERMASAKRIVQGRLSAGTVVELGIGCESCHLGAKAHVDDPSILPSFEPTSPLVRRIAPRREGAATAVNRACARCHQVLFTRYPWTWEGGRRRKPEGGSHISSGEARDFLLGGCSTALSCADCHDPHAASKGPRLKAGITDAAIDVVCVRCHTKYRGEPAARSHTHHDPRGTGGRCVACHMPKKNMSLESDLTRYHRIGRPNDPRRLYGDRPMECALCHVDKSVRELASSLQRWYGTAIDRAALAALYGDLDANVMAATLRRGKPHEKAVAMDLLGRAKRRDVAGDLVGELPGRYPLVASYANLALERIVDESSPVDLDAEPAVVIERARAWLAAAGQRASGAGER